MNFCPMMFPLYLPQHPDQFPDTNGSGQPVLATNIGPIQWRAVFTLTFAPFPAGRTGPKKSTDASPKAERRLESVRQWPEPNSRGNLSIRTSFYSFHGETLDTRTEGVDRKMSCDDSGPKVFYVLPTEAHKFTACHKPVVFVQFHRAD